MVIKVISEEPVYTLKTVCSLCFFRLEFTKVDVKSTLEDNLSYLICPKCDNTNWLSKDDLKIK